MNFCEDSDAVLSECFVCAKQGEFIHVERWAADVRFLI